MRDFRDVIEAWPSRADLAADTGARYGTVKQWWRRNSIPPEYWARLVTAARQRRIQGVIEARLAALAEQRSAA